MTARYLLAVFDSVYVIALASWIGSTLFFTFALTPIIFKVLGDENAGKLFHALLPRYYLWGAISGAAALPAFVAGPLCYREYRGAMVGVQALAMIGGILIMLYGGNSLARAIDVARDGNPASRERIRRLQRRARRLNAVVMAVGFGLLVAFATRPRPQTSGIIEMSPAERFRYDAAITRVMQDVEARYGLGPPRAGGPSDASASEPKIDAETVKEIESYYASKRLRDQARAGRAGKAAPAESTDALARPAPPPPRSAHPMGSGEGRVD